MKSSSAPNGAATAASVGINVPTTSAAATPNIPGSAPASSKGGGGGPSRAAPPVSLRGSPSATRTITVRQPATRQRPWSIIQTGISTLLEIDVSIPQRLPAGKILPRACKGIAMRKSGAAIADALLRVTINNQGPLAWSGGRFLVYDDGAFRPCKDEDFRALLMSWDGTPIGTRAQKSHLAMSKALAGDALSCLRDMLTSASTRFFDSAPNGIAFSNAFVTVLDGKLALRRHSPANRARHWIDVPYRRKASCRRFDRFLREIMMPAGSPTNAGELCAMIAEAEAKIRTFWEWLGCALLGQATTFGKALLVWGPGGGGKSTLLMVVSALWPAELRSSYPLQALEDQINRADLAGKLINICGELPAADADVVETAKAIITGRDDIFARHPYERPFSFRAIAAHLIAANRLPLIGDYTGAFFERFVVLLAERKFRDTGVEDHDLGQRIIQHELGAIAAKAIAHGAEAIRRGRITVPASSKTAIADWQALSDSVRAWFGEFGKLDPTFAHGGLQGGVVYRVYKAWAESRGYRPFANNIFTEHLKSIGVTSKPSKYGTAWGLCWVDPSVVARMFPTSTD